MPVAGRRAGGRLQGSFAKANLRVRQSLAACDAPADEFDNLRIFGERSMVQFVRRGHACQVIDLDRSLASALPYGFWPGSMAPSLGSSQIFRETASA
jgi:hypothetical protein